MSERTELARRVMKVLADGGTVPEKDAFQYESGRSSVRPKMCYYHWKCSRGAFWEIRKITNSAQLENSVG